MSCWNRVRSVNFRVLEVDLPLPSASSNLVVAELKQRPYRLKPCQSEVDDHAEPILKAIKHHPELVQFEAQTYIEAINATFSATKCTVVCPFLDAITPSMQHLERYAFGKE